jgi:hypothetical protein
MNEESPPEIRPIAVEGTDIDEAIKKAQDAQRMHEAFGVNPGEVVTNDQLSAMKDLQGAMDAHEDRIADRAATEAKGENYFIESNKPLDPIQTEQLKQSQALESLSELFSESSDKEHQSAAWQLFDEFIDQYNMSRNEERALRNHLMSINQEAPTPFHESIVPEHESTPPNAEGGTATQPDEEIKIEDNSQIPSSELTPEAAAENTTPESKDTITESIPAQPDNEIALENTIPAGETEKFEELTDESLNWDDEEQEVVKSTWQRIKEAPAFLAFKIDQFFNGGTPEQNKKRKLVAAAIGIGVVGVCVAVGIHNNNIHDAANAALGAQSGGGAGGVEAANHISGAIQEHLGSYGDTIWDHAKNTLQQWGVKPTNQNIMRLTTDILKDNGLSWSDARHLTSGYQFTINQPVWAL